MIPGRTALVLIGYQNDYFAPGGALRPFIESPERLDGVLDRTVALIESLAGTRAAILAAPIGFTADYSELVDPIGILRAIMEVGALQEGTPGAALVPRIAAERCTVIPGRRGLSAFSNTALASTLQAQGIEDVLIAGVVTSICIDSTAREAAERGFRVTIVGDCIAGRTPFEEAFYRSRIFPLYARIRTADEIVGMLG